MTGNSTVVSRTLPLAVGLANVAWAAALVLSAVLPMRDGPGFPVPDWLAHGVGYGVQAGLIWVLLRVRRDRPAARVSLPIAAATALGGVTELLQRFAPPRTAEWRDLAADALGAILVVVLLELTGRTVRRRPGEHVG